MKTLLMIALGLSFGANVWLLRARANCWTAAREASGPVEARDRAARPRASMLPVTELERAEPGALRDLLVAAGADEFAVRSVLDGVLRGRHREKLTAIRVERAHTAWWRAGRSVLAEDGRLLKAMVTDPLQTLLGPEPLDLLDAEARYSFLPPEKRRLLAQIDFDYTELQRRVPGPGTNNAQLQAEVRELRLLADERRKDVVAALTSDEKGEYDLRFSGTAGMISRRMETMAATEAEFRAIKPMIDDFDEKARALPKGRDFAQAYDELQRTMVEKLTAALGEPRAADFIWSGNNNDFAALSRAAAAANLSADVPRLVMELAADTGNQAATVHDDARLTLEQKRAALGALQGSSRERLDALLPPAAQRTLGPDTLRWLEALGEGRYFMVFPSLLSSGGYANYDITKPSPATRTKSPLLPIHAR